MMAVISVLKNLAKRKTETENAIAGALAQVNEIREIMDIKTRERAETDALPVPPEEAKVNARRWLNSLEIDVMDGGCFSTGSAHDWPLASDLATVLPRLFIEALRDRLEEKLDAKINDYYEVREYATAAERAERIAEIDGEIAALGKGEETLIRAAEAAGVAIPRRGAADPAIVIAADSALAA